VVNVYVIASEEMTFVIKVIAGIIGVVSTTVVMIGEAIVQRRSSDE
jgi:hypothetical protein